MCFPAGQTVHSPLSVSGSGFSTVACRWHHVHSLHNDKMATVEGEEWPAFHPQLFNRYKYTIKDAADISSEGIYLLKTASGKLYLIV